MIRALLGYACAWLAFSLATLSRQLLRAPPLPAPELALTTERYVHELPSLPLARADGLLGLVLGGGIPVYFDGHNFSKVVDARWRQ